MSDSSGITAAAVQIAMWALVNGESQLYSTAAQYAANAQFEYLAGDNSGNYNAILSDANSLISTALANAGTASGYWEDASPSGNQLGRGQSLIGPGAGVNPFDQTTLVPAPSSTRSCWHRPWSPPSWPPALGGDSRLERRDSGESGPGTGIM